MLLFFCFADVLRMALKRDLARLCGGGLVQPDSVDLATAQPKHVGVEEHFRQLKDSWK